MGVSCLSPPLAEPAGSCVSQIEMGLANGHGALFTGTAKDLARYVDCANSSPDCTSALNCATNHHGPDWCNSHPYGGCDGDVLIASCHAGWGLEQLDCAALGMHCQTGANGDASCTDGTTCDPSHQNQRCDGNRAVSCNPNGLEVAYDCGTVYPGGSCQQMPNGPECAPPPDCAVGSDHCDGKILVACVGEPLRIDCSQFASHCVVDASGRGTCAPDASDCTQSSPDSCVGDALQLCVNGTWQQTSCASIGLSSCALVMGLAKCS